MNKIAYLASRDTLPSSHARRTDAFEHDQSVAALREPFQSLGMQLCPLAWDDPQPNWSTFAAALVGTTWDYWNRKAQFLSTLERIESQTRLFNTTRQIRWNICKTYLRDLEACGIPLIPTLWLDQPGETVFDILQAEDLVFKRQIGAGAAGQHRLRRGESFPEMPEPMMIQPFLPTILSEGELSFVFIDGQLSHSLRKRPADQDYRVQSAYGGFEETAHPPARDKAAAVRVMNVLKEVPLYARVDMVRGADGELLLMELEIIEPFLYPRQGPELGLRLAKALGERLASF